MENNSINRRGFLSTTSAAAVGTSAVAGLLTQPSGVRAQGANKKIRIGFIGPGGRGFGAHVKSLAKIAKEDNSVELTATCDVYSIQNDKVADYIAKELGVAPKKYLDYKDLLADPNVDAVCIGTPDHWHHLQTVDAMKAGKHVYCEKPMTHSIEEAIDVVNVWKKTGKIMQVGVQSTSLPVWDMCREMINDGMLGKVLMFQTEYFRNSGIGQWRYYGLTKEMTPQTIDWQRWLGVKEGLAESMPFDRAVYAQWRRFWPFGSGMYTDLFVHRTTSMLKGTGLRFPRRVVGAGGIFFEYDGRDVPDVATVVADFDEGVQGLVTATMCAQETPIKQVIRGHNGSFVFGNGENFSEIEFVAERPQVTRKKELVSKTIPVEKVADSTLNHFRNWVKAMQEGKQQLCNNPPDLGAAAIVMVTMGARSYREGKAFFFDKTTEKVVEADASWATQWEKVSKARGKPKHVPGWRAGDTGSVLEEPEYMALAGPWVNGRPPEATGAGGP